MATGSIKNPFVGLSYTQTGLGTLACTIEGGYAKLGNIVIVNISINATSAGALVSGFPRPAIATIMGTAGYDAANERAAYLYLNTNGNLTCPAALGTGTFLVSFTYLTSA